MRTLSLLGVAIYVLLAPAIVQAAEDALPSQVRQAVVRVVCDNRQGSGTLVSADGFVLTNAHVVANVEVPNPQPATECRIGIIDPETEQVRYSYRARVERWILNIERNQDFALLRLTTPASREELLGNFPFLKIWEFSAENERLWTIGFPSGAYTVQPGYIQGFGNGFIRTTAVFRPGNSGGAAINEQNRLIGIPTRIVTITEDGKAQRVRYELVDIRAVLQWLDSISPNESTRFFTFADPERSRRNVSFIEQSSLECDYLVRARSVSAVFCLLPGLERYTFPNAATFLSWYPNFATVQTVDDSELADFQLKRNVTLRPGTLVKSATYPQVYLITDVFGTMRHIPSETRARELWGPNWGSLVHDIPDEFFTNYTVAAPLE